MSAPVFWYEMTYACDRCGLEMKFLLEDGLEGPRDTKRPPPPEMVEAQRRNLPFPGIPGAIPFSASGRVVLPVPFVAAGCPKCQGAPPWQFSGGVLQHVRWESDRRLDPPHVGVPEGPHFRYPPDPYAYHACGEVVVVGSPSRGER